jgi:hypothetical protein
MCTYIDALCVPTLDGPQLERIQYLCKVASWHWYKFLPRQMHTLLAHAMLHLAEQTAFFGPQVIFWLFHKERSPLPPARLMRSPGAAHAHNAPAYAH